MNMLKITAAIFALVLSANVFAHESSEHKAKEATHHEQNSNESTEHSAHHGSSHDEKDHNKK